MKGNFARFWGCATYFLYSNHQHRQSSSQNHSTSNGGDRVSRAAPVNFPDPDALGVEPYRRRIGRRWLADRLGVEAPVRSVWPPKWLRRSVIPMGKPYQSDVGTSDGRSTEEFSQGCNCTKFEAGRW